MFRELKILAVELNTPKGSVFSCHARSVELRTTDGVIAINPQKKNYLNLTQTTHITLCVGTEFLDFELRNAVASLGDGMLTVLAEDIQRMPRDSIPITSPNGHFVP